MRKRLENVYGTALSKTLRAINPIKKTVIKTDCEVHLFIQQSALDILKSEGYHREFELFQAFIPQINKGLVWADLDFKSYHHFYNPRVERGRFGYEDNALTVTRSYYNKALKFFAMGNYERSMFYFGAACHIVQDLTIPQHAKGKLLDNHRQFEVYVKSNYKNIKRFKSHEKPIYLYSMEEYINFNAQNALKLDYMYKNIESLSTKFYLIATKSITLAQRSTAGCMLMFYRDIINS